MFWNWTYSPTPVPAFAPTASPPSLFTAVFVISDNSTSIPSLSQVKNLKVTPDYSLFCTLTHGPFINGQFNCSNVARIQLHLPVAAAPPSLSMPVHAVRVTFLRPLTACTWIERHKGAKRMDRGLHSNHTFYGEPSSAFPLPAGSARGSWPWWCFGSPHLSHGDNGNPSI